MNDLKEENIKLKFVQPRKEKSEDTYALLSTKSLGHNPFTIYISVQPEGPHPNSEGRLICKYNYFTDKIERIKLDETQDFTEELSFEGYKCGHKLSHAIAFVRFYKSQTPRPSDANVGNVWAANYNNPHSAMYWSTEIYSNMLNMFSTSEEYRNVLGLGLEKTFEDPNRIIGEFDYLNKLMEKRVGASSDVIYFRMPYDEKCWDQDIALDLCQKKYHQLHPKLPIKRKSHCTIL